MAAPRLRCLSARVDEDTYTALCIRAQAQGETVSSLVAQLLATGCKTPPPAAQVGDEAESDSVTVTGLDRLVNLERWVQFFFLFHIYADLTILERQIECPSCGQLTCHFHCGEVSEGTAHIVGFACPQCGWEVTDHETYAAAYGDENEDMDDPSPTGQGGTPSAS